jgi:hypothetical protein
MSDAIPLLLYRWQNFYVMIGSSAAALTGLQFVVLAIILEIRPRNTTGGIGAFSTPTVVYFSTSLLVAAVMCAPWSGMLGVMTIVAGCGAAGVVYSLIVGRRALAQDAYKLVLEDWLWHVIFPLLAQLMLLAGGIDLRWDPRRALFVIAGGAVLFLFVGIHNAWDTVTYIVLLRLRSKEEQEEAALPPPPA